MNNLMRRFILLFQVFETLSHTPPENVSEELYTIHLNGLEELFRGVRAYLETIPAPDQVKLMDEFEPDWDELRVDKSRLYFLGEHRHLSEQVSNMLGHIELSLSYTEE